MKDPRPLPTEGQVQTAIIGAFWYRHRVRLFVTDAGGKGFRAAMREGAKGYSGLPEGFADLMGVIPPIGRALFIEVKRPWQRPTAEQLAFLEARRKEGAIAFWADSVTSALAQFEAATAEGAA